MSITTYTELKSAVADYLHRSDLTTPIPDFIAIGEARLNRELKLLQSQQTAALTCSIGSRYVALPALFQEAVSLTITPATGSVPEALAYRDGPDFEDAITVTNGLPRLYRIDTRIEFDKPANVAYALALRYIKKWNIATDSTNYVLTNWPDIYLYASIQAAAPYLRDESLNTAMEALLAPAIEFANRVDGNTRGRAMLSTPFSGAGRSWIEQDSP